MGELAFELDFDRNILIFTDGNDAKGKIRIKKCVQLERHKTWNGMLNNLISEVLVVAIMVR